MDNLRKDSVGSTYDVYKLVTTDIANDNTLELYRTDKQTFTLRTTGAHQHRCDMDADELTQLADNIDRSTYYGTYRDIIGDEEWLQLYDYSKQHVRAKFGAAWTTTYIDVIPCYYCGLALPIELIEVDHWCEVERRDSGRVQAVLKVLRAIGNGLTVGQATGKKASQAGPIMSSSGITPVDTRNGGPDLSSFNLNTVRERLNVNKRKLSDEGRLALSALYVGVGANDTDGFFKYFLNNFFNLVPSCGSCNKAKNSRT
jgi:hypothetical protein